MATINQLIRKNRSKKKIRISKSVSLGGCPQKRGVCLKVYKMAPRKPNSARRCVVKVRYIIKRV